MKLLLLLLNMVVLVLATPPQHITCKKISEASGLLHSTKYPNVFWVHNDSGDKPRLYAIDTQSLQLINTIKVKKAKHRDWEDMTFYNGEIVIGDFGNNKSKRDDLMLYFIDEPNPYKETKVRVRKKVPFTYSDQEGSDLRNYDCEALLSFNDTLYLLTKHREDRNTTLYKLHGNVAHKVIDYPIDGKVTAADSNGVYVAVLTYDRLYILEPTADDDNLFSGKVYRKRIDAGQVEGVTFVGDSVKIVNEDGEMFTFHLNDIIKG